MRDDMDRALREEAGQEGRYISQLDFYFEGKSYLNVYWSDADDENYETTSGWRHGASPYGTQPFKPSSISFAEGDVLVGTAALFYNSNLKAFAFEQKSLDGTSKFQVIEPFGASELPESADFLERVREDNTYDNTNWWTTELDVAAGSDPPQCMQNAVDTQLVGFATTNEGDNSKKIRSIQPIYYSESETVCGCLDGSPALSSKTVIESEPFKGTDTIGKLWANGQLDVVIDTILFVIALTLALGIIGCCLCFWSSYQFPKRKLAREPEFYEELARITKQKNDALDGEYQVYKQKGIRMFDKHSSSDNV